MPTINQANVSGSEVRKILIPIVSKKIQEDVADIFNKAIAAIRKSEASYVQAKKILESELGLDRLHFQKPMGYLAQFSEVEVSRRCDSDYFQPKYRQLDTMAAKYPVARIKMLAEKLETGLYSPSYTLDGKPYIRGCNISAGYIENEGMLKSKAIAITPNAIVKEDDILVTRVGSIGVCGIVERELSGSLFSDNLIRIRLTEKIKKTLSPHCFNLLLNTTYGQMQMVRYSRGSVQQRLNQSQLAQIPIPCIGWDAQQEIEKNLLKHRSAKKDSVWLLAEAKARVEQLIEEAVAK